MVIEERDSATHPLYEWVSSIVYCFSKMAITCNILVYKIIHITQMSCEKYNFCLALVFCLLISGCGGRVAKPVAIKKPGDSSISCAKIEEEINLIRKNISNLLSDSIDNTEQDTFVGLIASFFPPAYVFRDFRQAEKVEINALRKRHNRIVKLAQQKECGKNKFFLPIERKCKDYYVLDCFLPSGKG